MIKSFALIILSSVIGFAQQNLQENYIPLKSSGALPDIFTQNIRNVITSDINDLYKQKETDKLIKQGLLEDPLRGTTTSSAQRESPSAVFGINTP